MALYLATGSLYDFEAGVSLGLMDFVCRVYRLPAQ